MANVYAVKSGNWSDTTVWNTGALPTSADDVYSNTFTVTVDISPTVLSVRNTSGTGITAGGGFNATNGITLTCTGSGVFAGPGNCITSNLTSGQSCTITANCTGSGTNSFSAVINNSSGTVFINGNCSGAGGPAAYGANNNSSGTLTVTGNCSAGSGQNARGVNNQGFGTVNIIGNCTGGSFNGAGVFNNGAGTVNITGDCTGGTDSLASGAYNNSTGAINITGSCRGSASQSGHGANNIATGTINITGTSTGSSASTGVGFINSSTGTITHIGTAQASATAPAIGVGAVGQVTILTGPLLSTDAGYTGAASSGVNPCVALRWFPANTALSTFEYRMRGQTVAGSPSARPARQMFLTDAYDATYPTAANVRSGTAYGPSSIYTGTCAVPAAASVVVGAAVDNTVGTAAITAATIRNAVGLASANLDTQLSGITSGISGLPSASAIASAVWAAATRTLTTAIDNSSTIAAAVWSYATGRTITGGTVDTLVNSPSVPSAASIASQVRTELTPELARVANCATTQEVDDIVEGALS